ncbi:DNA polymerase III subunit gamma/tau [Wenzhouxiangella sp. XN79A]|uniref:DNA polymerase III subunit gamma/tau n=1 Tax=Wenzhouxiangella sp. XN79A TaxID=2724193 RepID=UPI00144AAE3B|nr:DNA polymerase III subunit gamma/tau [Wenzhouxiangella sp. XN79A]NKI36287.1 DNA polymerase III subunit gamma/tau [Wenzhouxiangella sp. XN79A]
MSYQVIARKWRPRSFADLVGQQHVVQALSNGLNEGRLHHAFLFTGTRGVGKTTIARILAKSLNCETGVTAEPCGECAHCVAIDEGRFVDLMEIDAASRTKVDDTREILDNVQYAPARGRFKVYLIDEVHMLSTHSFNALLKTLEEPPEHVKFVLATTDPQKIPVTILSRCMQFNLRRLGVDEIGGQIRRILDAEQLTYDDPAVALLARAADGSMRDGLSLLDQALAAGSGALVTQPVEDMLGTVEQRHLADIIEGLIENDAGRALAAVDEVFSLARDLGRLLGDLAETLHRISLIQHVPDYRDDSRSDWEPLVDWAARLNAEDVQLYYQIAVTGKRDLGLAPSMRTGCEMTLLRMFAFTPADQGQARPAAGSDRPAAAAGSGTTAASASSSPAVHDRPPTRPAPPSKAASAESAPEPAAPPSTPEPSVVDAPAAVAAPKLAPETWAQVLEGLDVNGSVRAVAGLLALKAVDDDRLEFRVSRDDLPLISDRFKASLTDALARQTGGERRIDVKPVDDDELITPAKLAEDDQAQRQADAEAAVATDPVVRTLKDTFDAEVVPGSVRPGEPTRH